MERRAAGLRAFDILLLGGRDLRPLPAIERKAIQWNLVKPATGIIQCSQHVEGNGAEFFAAVDKMGLEGIVSKRCNSPYRAGKSDSWVEGEMLGRRRFRVDRGEARAR